MRRRKTPRIEYLTETVLESASGKREARISDLSPGGCYIDSIASVQIGEKVSFEIVVLPGVRMALIGEVAYIHDGNGFGIKFTDLTDEQRDFIDKLVKSNEDGEDE